MARTRTEVQAELDALHIEIVKDQQSDAWAYDDTAAQDLHDKQAREHELELELASLEP
ncbi:MAG: hypothetical protein WDN27_01340 [Candidatus Saccharibacteria bacterium]